MNHGGRRRFHRNRTRTRVRDCDRTRPREGRENRPGGGPGRRLGLLPLPLPPADGSFNDSYGFFNGYVLPPRLYFPIYTYATRVFAPRVRSRVVSFGRDRNPTGVTREHTS